MIAENGGHGANCPANATVQNCLLVQNALDGIIVGSGSLVTGNRVLGFINVTNANAAIRVIASNNRIENNHIANYPNGIVVPNGGNLIVRNSTANVVTNYVIGFGNTFGPTNIVPGVATNHPWANFSF